MKAALIATGNEVVSGQILNTNTSWLASELSAEGLDTHFHMAVLDNSEDLLKSLKWLLEQGVDHVFISGGLGPTRDDLTRQIVADFCKKEFEFHELRWLELESILIKKGITPREGHKWQCYFPEGASHLINSVGTAWGFQTSTENSEMKIWALPGPPVELENVYENSVKPWLRKHVKPKTKLVTWQCFNTPESEVAYLTEEVLKGCSYEVGYRASPPITEVKLWVPVEEFENNLWCEKLDALYKEILYSKNNTDFLETVLKEFKGKRFVVYDDLTQGDLLGRIKSNYPQVFLNMEYVLSPSHINSEGGFLRLCPEISSKEGVCLYIKTGENSKDTGIRFFEEISHELLMKSARARKYVLAKLIKRAALESLSDLV